MTDGPEHSYPTVSRPPEVSQRFKTSLSWGVLTYRHAYLHLELKFYMSVMDEMTTTVAILSLLVNAVRLGLDL